MCIIEITRVPLLIPLTVEGKTYTEISLRRAKVKDLREISKKEGIKQTIEMIACLSGWSYDMINKLDEHDFSNIKDILDSSVKKALDKIISISNDIKMALKNPFISYVESFIHKIKTLMGKIMNVCIFSNTMLEKCKNSLYKDIFETTDIKNIKEEIFSDYTPITVHNPSNTPIQMNIINYGTFIQNSPSEHMHIASHPKTENTTKKPILDIILKLSDIASKILNLPSWCWELLLKRLK
ncbi:phage tail assembly protein [Bartonella grahamii]|uniref:phage tail assembly protein n=1 Tax=Bartonella grahamii TaxID=33045 RepID=UPI001ABBDCBE|nr:phage tail assembly protein [Bartonella grahamii]